MDNCCNDKANELAILRTSHRKILLLVLAINGLMFFVEIAAGIAAQSTSLLADSLDMLGDTLVYACSLYVLEKSARAQAKVSLIKGGVMMLFGFGVMAEAFEKFVSIAVPSASIITGVGTLAMLMNGLCFYLLWRHRGDNLNMRSTWLCSRNDVVANLAVIIAGLLTFVVQSRWPDLFVGFIIALLFIKSAWSIIQESTAELKSDSAVTAEDCCSNTGAVKVSIALSQKSDE